MTNYIVKNCPSFVSKFINRQQTEYNECLCTITSGSEKLEMKKCENVTDCPIKQVVELCKRNLCDSSACNLEGTERCNSECCFFPYNNFSRRNLARPTNRGGGVDVDIQSQKRVV